MKRITRNKLLIWIIVIGLINFAAYAVLYGYLQGDARNGFIKDGEYFLRGHFIRTRGGLASAPVSRTQWIFSFVHSISIWPTIGAVLISMLILSRPHIIATMKSDSLVSGRSFVKLCLTVVLVVTVTSTALFVVNLIQALRAAAVGGNYGL